MSNDQVIRKWYEEVWNNKSEDAIDEIFSATAIAHGLVDENNNEIVGPEKFKVFFKKFISSFPDMMVSVEDTINEGDKIAARVTARLTHSGTPFQVSDEKFIVPSGKNIAFSGISITVIRNRQIQEAWNSFDFLSFYVQLDAFA